MEDRGCPGESIYEEESRSTLRGPSSDDIKAAHPGWRKERTMKPDTPVSDAERKAAIWLYPGKVPVSSRIRSWTGRGSQQGL